MTACGAAIGPIECQSTVGSREMSAPLEKTPLETYVPPKKKPSLIGLSRAEIAARLADRVAQAQRKMRAQQLWHWISISAAPRARRDDLDLQRRAPNWISILPSIAPRWSPSQISNDGTRNGCCACRAAIQSKGA